MRQRVLRIILAMFAALALVVPTAAAGSGEQGARSAKLAGALDALLAKSRPDDQIRVIVQGSAAADAASEHGHVRKRLGIVGGVAATVPAASLHRLANDRRVEFVAPDAPIAFAAEGAVSAASLATFFPGRDSASNPWSAGAIGRGVGIAVIDSGVTPGVDFGSRLVQVRLDGQEGSLDDSVGHGTLVAGVAAGRSPNGEFMGIAPGATVYAINVSRPTGVYSSDVITALKWVFDNAHTYNIRVVNLSLSETIKSSYKTSALDLAVERLWARGVFVVVAAGNRGAGEIDYAPANDPLAMTIGGFDLMGTSGPGDDTYSAWSSSGLTLDGFSKPELVAPGRHIGAPLPAGTMLDGQAPTVNRVAAGYANINGTSFAAPQAAGAAAIIFQWHPTWSPDNVKWALIAKQGPKPRSSRWGSLSLSSSYNYAGTPGRANDKVPALVCAPGKPCLNDGTIASLWDSSGWTADSWVSNGWTSSTWNSNGWTTAADWSSNGWTSNGWTSNGWTSNGWTSVSWTSTDGSFDLWK
jgi:serine protease AprX